MDSKDSTSASIGLPLSRRQLLVGLLSAYTASLIPWALAQEVPEEGQASFMALSALIAGRQTLNPELARRIYQALDRSEPDFAARTQQLLALVEEQKIDPLQLQAVLDEQYPQLAPIPRKLATAWFLGVVEVEGQARAIAYEEALNAVLVADVLMPPSYCYGAYGSWAEPPSLRSTRQPETQPST